MDFERSRAAMRASFADYAQQFLSAARETWADDAATRRVLDAWAGQLDAAVAAAGDSETRRAALFDALAVNFHALFKEHYSAIAACDLEAMFGTRDAPREPNAWTAAVRASVLLHAAHPADVAVCWEFAQELARYANMYVMYKRCPPALLSQIHRMAASLRSRMDDGVATAADLNPLALGRALMAEMKGDDLSSFGARMLEDGALDGMIAMLQSMISALGKHGGHDTSALAGISPADMMAAMARTTDGMA